MVSLYQGFEHWFARRGFMKLHLVSGTGRGSTTLSAFDAALHDCGVHNYNLIPLSSVIPPGTTVVEEQRFIPECDQHGHRLYVVMAEKRTDCPGTAVAAGIGWYQWGDDRGVFVEHEAAGSYRASTEDVVRRRIIASLRDLCAVRDIPFCEHAAGIRAASAVYDEKPAAALVIAVYGAQPWT
jgi:arginine decarboxylase